MKDLGLGRSITRRDFLDGMRIAAYGSTPLTYPEFAADERPNVLGRRPFGRIHVASSDAAASAYTHAAIDEAHRAVAEILGSKESENAF